MTELTKEQPAAWPSIATRRATLEHAIAEWQQGHTTDQRDAELAAIIKAGVQHVVHGGEANDELPF